MLTIISLGAGVQSTAMTLMAARGELTPMPDAAIFADTGGEPQAVYDHLEWLQRPGLLPFPIHIASAGSLWEAAINVRTRADGKVTYIDTGIPVFLTSDTGGGIGRRQCTSEFKIVPIERKLRELLGKKQIRKTDGPLVEMWMGISTDEALRKKPARQPWIRARWPLLEKYLNRKDCLAWMEKQGYPPPPKSACTFCPYHDDRAWLALPPEELADVIEKEKAMQAAYAKASNIKGIPYFHRSLKPLSEVQFNPSPERPEKQIDLFINECEGMCGV